MYYLGVDIGGTTIKAGLVDEASHLSNPSRISTDARNWPDFLSSLVSLIRRYQDSTPIVAVGIGVPGLMNSRTGTVETSPNLPCLANVRLGSLVADEVHVPVVAENDANAAAYAEFSAGSGKGVRNMACLTLGTGLGSGVILDGRLLRGASGYAVEFGHSVIEPGGRPCTCGGTGCLETLVSARGILQTAWQILAKHPESRLHASADLLTPERLFEAAEAGDPAAIETFEQTGYWLGLGCANLINIFNLDLIAIGGGIGGAASFLMGPVKETAGRHAIGASFRDCRIVQSMFGPEAGIIGAAMLARNSVAVT